MKKAIVIAIYLLIFYTSIQSQDINLFEKDIENYAGLLKLPGLAVGVAKGDSLIYFKGTGYADTLHKEPITKDHINSEQNVKECPGSSPG